MNRKPQEADCLRRVKGKDCGDDKCATLCFMHAVRMVVLPSANLRECCVDLDGMPT